MSLPENTTALVEDARFHLFLDGVSKLHDVAVDVLDGSGEKVFGVGADAAGTDFRRPLLLWGKEAGAIKVRGAESADGRVEEIARIIAAYAESVLDSEYQLGSLAEEISVKYEEVNLLYDLSDELAALFDEEKIGETILERIRSIVPVRCGAVMVLDGDRYATLSIQRADVCCETCRWTSASPDENGALGEVIRKKRSILVTDEEVIGNEFPMRGEGSPVHSFLAVPMLRSPGRENETVMGAIVLTSRMDGKPFTTGDEKLVSAMASQASTAIYNAQLVRELKESERMKRDLELARQIQESLLPKEAPEVPGAELAGRCKTAAKVGGDYYGYVVREGKSVSVILGDVTGHDLGAALIMGAARATLLATATETDDPSAVLAKANRLLYRDLTSSHLMISLFAASYSAGDRKLLFANGGHNPPLLARAKGGDVEELDAEGLILGVEEEFEYELGARDLEAGDAVLFYTDGIVEARSNVDETFGEERLGRLLTENRGLSAEEIVDSLYREADEFTAGTDIKDDITMVVLKVK